MEKYKNLVSVIIPNFNAAKWLDKTLQSVIDQGPVLKEIIVVDDNSTDNSMDILQRWAQQYPNIIKVFTNPNAKGGNNARNYGFEQSTGKYINWLDADDQIFENKLQQQVAYFEAHPSTGLVYSDAVIDYYNPDGTLNHRDHDDHKKGYIKDYLLASINDTWVPPFAYLVARPVAQQAHLAKGWNPETPIAQDREYFTTCCIINPNVGYVPLQAGVLNRWHGANQVSYNQKNIQRKRITLNKILYKFKDLLFGQAWPTPAQQHLYQSAIDTELVNNYGFETRTIVKSRFRLKHHIKIKNIRWQQIYSKRIKLQVPLILLFHKLFVKPTYTPPQNRK